VIGSGLGVKEMLVQHRSRTMAAIAVALAAVVATAALAAPATARGRPVTINLPADFAPEGVAIGRGGTFYAGTRTGGQVARGDIRDDAPAEVFVDAPLVAAATGLKADVRHGLLWVAGAGTGHAAVYDLDTGDGVKDLTLATTTPSFINDVVVTRDAAYFTNSRARELYRVPVSSRGEVGAPVTIPLSGPAATDFVNGQTNLNGIDANSDGRTLFVVNSTKGTLYTVDAETGASAAIDLGGATVPTGDGILLVGRDLLVLQNGGGVPANNKIVVVRLRDQLTRGQIVDTITSTRFDQATTLARSGNTLVAVNAQFATPTAVPKEVVLLRR
jgi:hypothetical protein